jgi:hypothetical protein
MSAPAKITSRRGGQFGCKRTESIVNLTEVGRGRSDIDGRARVLQTRMGICPIPVRLQDMMTADRPAIRPLPVPEPHATGQETETSPRSLPSPEALIADVVENGIRRYVAARRQRVPGFVARHFSLRGSIALHRRALGFDLLRAPANLLLIGPHAGMKAVGMLADKLGAYRIARSLQARNLLLSTDVASEIEWLVLTELLELPCRQPQRESGRDALAETILDDPRLTGLAVQQLSMIGRHADEPALRARLVETMTSYATTRAAAADITTSLFMSGMGALVLKQLTPGAVTLGPALATLIAQQSAIATFPLGAGFGALWYAMFPVSPPATLVAGVTAGSMIAASCVAAFAGVVTDPIQHRLGLHARRLCRLLDAVERQMLDPGASAYLVYDHYVARLLNFFDLLGSAYSVVR